MRAAIIDCGTNTFNILVAELANNTFRKVFSSKIPVKLGEGGNNLQAIAPEAFQRGVSALIKFKHYTERYQVQQVCAFATAAIRDASNGIEFKNQVWKETGINLTIIDGSREAELIYKGNIKAVKVANESVLIMDIGGGSNEYIIGNHQKIFWKQSFRHGAARMLEKFKPSDPLSPQNISDFNQFMDDELKSLSKAINEFNPKTLIGSSGAFDSIVELIHARLHGESFSEEKTAYSVNLTDYHSISSFIKNSKYAERLNMPGLAQMRADMMVISCLLMDYIIQLSKPEQFIVSAFSLKEGALMELLSQHNT